MKKENEFSCLFGQCYIVAKKTTELVHLFRKNITKLDFLSTILAKIVSKGKYVAKYISFLVPIFGGN